MPTEEDESWDMMRARRIFVGLAAVTPVIALAAPAHAADYTSPGSIHLMSNLGQVSFGARITAAGARTPSPSREAVAGS